MHTEQSQRERILTMRRHEHLSPQEIAERLGCSQRTVYQALRALGELSSPEDGKISSDERSAPVQ